MRKNIAFSFSLDGRILVRKYVDHCLRKSLHLQDSFLTKDLDLEEWFTLDWQFFHELLKPFHNHRTQNNLNEIQYLSDPYKNSASTLNLIILPLSLLLPSIWNISHYIFWFSPHKNLSFKSIGFWTLNSRWIAEMYSRNMLLWRRLFVSSQCQLFTSVYW